MRTCKICLSGMPDFFFGSRSRGVCFECFHFPPVVPRDVPPREAATCPKLEQLPPAVPGVLTKTQAAAYALRRSGLSVTAIARRLNRGASAVERLLSRARMRIGKNVGGVLPLCESAKSEAEAA